MADDKSSMFSERARQKLRSADDLNKFVRVTNPSVWVILGACAAMVAGVLAWAFFGSANTNIEVQGTYVDGQALSLLSPDEVQGVDLGDLANVAGKQTTVAEVASKPVSAREAEALLGGDDFLTNTLMQGGSWAYLVRYDTLEDTEGLEDGVPISVNITTEQLAPIKLIFGGSK